MWYDVAIKKMHLNINLVSLVAFLFFQKAPETIFSIYHRFTDYPDVGCHIKVIKLSLGVYHPPLTASEQLSSAERLCGNCCGRLHSHKGPRRLTNTENTRGERERPDETGSISRPVQSNVKLQEASTSSQFPIELILISGSCSLHYISQFEIPVRIFQHILRS